MAVYYHCPSPTPQPIPNKKNKIIHMSLQYHMRIGSLMQLKKDAKDFFLPMKQHHLTSSHKTVTQKFTYASQPLNSVARATRLTPRVNAPMRRLQLCVWHKLLMLWKDLVMHLLSSLFTFSSSHIKPCMFCKNKNRL